MACLLLIELKRVVNNYGGTSNLPVGPVTIMVKGCRSIIAFLSLWSCVDAWLVGGDRHGVLSTSLGAPQGAPGCGGGGGGAPSGGGGGGETPCCGGGGGGGGRHSAPSWLLMDIACL